MEECSMFGRKQEAGALPRAFETYDPGMVQVGDADYETYDAGDRYGPALAVYSTGDDAKLVFLGADADSARNFAGAVSNWADDYASWSNPQGPGS
jgi:hypothetical protein